MPKCFDAVDAQHGYLVSITRKQFGVFLDINFFQGVEFVTPRGAHLCFHFITEVTAGLGVESHEHFGHE